jgi:DNA-binding CsgD family transcriptional regulator
MKGQARSIEEACTRFQLCGRWYTITPHPRSQEQKESAGAGTDPANDTSLGVLKIDGKCYCIAPSAGPRDGTSGESAPHPLNLLTQRELQVAVLVGSGLTNRQIAERLHISGWTVASHLRRIFSKVGVETRAAMIFKCFHSIGAPD